MWLRGNGFVYSSELSGMGFDNFTETIGAVRREAPNMVVMEQVHGAEVYKALPGDAGRRILSADGIFVDPRDSGRAFLLGVFTADCVPLFGINKKSGAYGIFHAGWKGIEAGIVEKAVKALGAPGELFFELGPHICGRCYKVGAEFARKFPAGYSNGFMSLTREIIFRLNKAGAGEKNINTAPDEEFCTFHNKELFYSYRRDGSSGRMLSAITKRETEQ